MSEGTTPKDIVQRAYVTAGPGIVINRVGEKEGVPIIEVTLAPDVIAALKIVKAAFDAWSAQSFESQHELSVKLDDRVVRY